MRRGRCLDRRERARFDREVKRLLAYPVRALVVEATWPEIELGEWRSRLTPNQVTAALVGWLAHGLPVMLTGNHERTGQLVAKILFTTARRRLRECAALTRITNGNHK